MRLQLLHLVAHILLYISERMKLTRRQVLQHMIAGVGFVGDQYLVSHGHGWNDNRFPVIGDAASQISLEPAPMYRSPPPAYPDAPAECAETSAHIHSHAAQTPSRC